MASISQQSQAPSLQTQRETLSAARRAHHRNELIRKAILTFVTLIVVAIFVFPIYWWVGASFKPFQYFFQMPPHVTFEDTTTTWWEVVVGGRDYGEVVQELGGRRGTGGGGSLGYYSVPYIMNSIIIGFVSTGIVILVSTLAAYALSRLKVWGEQNWIFFVISTRFMPPVAVVLPLYLMYNRLGWLDTYHGVILAHVTINLPIAILLLKSFFDDIPQDLDDAALVDGANRWTTFWRVILPLAAPGLAAAAILVLIFSWNEFLLTLYLTDTQIRTLPVAISTFDSSSGGTEWGFLAAAGSAAMIPVLIFILFVQRHLVRGLTLGAVKS